MEKKEQMDAALRGLQEVITSLRVLADSLEAVCGKPEIVPPEEDAMPAAEISLETVRGVLADRSRAGYTAQVREIIKRHGADRLSEIDPKEYPMVIAEAEALK